MDGHADGYSIEMFVADIQVVALENVTRIVENDPSVVLMKILLKTGGFVRTGAAAPIVNVPEELVPRTIMATMADEGDTFE